MPGFRQHFKKKTEVILPTQHESALLPQPCRKAPEGPIQLSSTILPTG
jgi:hypothetical protein